MTSFKLSKVLALSTLAAALLPTFVTSAYIKDLHEGASYESDVQVAAEALVQKIKDDPSNNHVPIPGHNAYNDLRVVAVDPNFSGTYEVDDQTNALKRIDVTSVSFQAAGVPMFSNYAATLSVSVSLTPDCKLVDGTRVYTILKSNSSLVDALFKKDITGRNYNPKYEAYGDVIFNSMLETSPILKAFCQ